jgi:archaemetzincin
VRVVLVPLGPVDEDILTRLAADLRRAAAIEVERGEPALLVPEDRSPRMDRYRSSVVLYRLPQPPPGRHLFAVTGADLFGGGFHFVFGHADPGSRRAVVSLARLGDAADQDDAFRRRLLVESLHELGHLDGMQHCPDSGCAMDPFFTLYELDRRSAEYCDRCGSIMGRGSTSVR